MLLFTSESCNFYPACVVCWWGERECGKQIAFIGCYRECGKRMRAEGKVTLL